MKVSQTELDGVVIIEPRVVSDDRGCFFESYSQREFDSMVRPVRFVQDNESVSCRGVVRGLHFQRAPHAQSKLVRVTEGRVLDFVVDIRRGSPTFARHVSLELSGDNRRQLFIPRGFAHGFAVLSDRAVLQYKCDDFYAPQSEGVISVNDSSLGLDLHLNPSEIILSARDAAAPLLSDAGELFDYNTDYYA
ncbi:MAG: dTDP-4-dehydrorhamnose 3,5-epimerase [Alistipes sp.]|nr:dTDP-4-dehydrorhamnose 3,5-epimerase [Alistipes sp.]